MLLNPSYELSLVVRLFYCCSKLLSGTLTPGQCQFYAMLCGEMGTFLSWLNVVAENKKNLETCFLGRRVV